jgi:hypothetical protein
MASGGFRSVIGRHYGGIAGATTAQQGAFRSVFMFWLGGAAGEVGDVEPPEPPVTGVGGGESGRPGAKYRKRKRIEWLPPDVDIETGERLPPPEAAAPVKLSKGERRVARLVAQYRGRDDDVAERARESLEALHRAQNSELARFIARQQALDEQRRGLAAAAADDDEAAIAFMQWLIRNP